MLHVPAGNETVIVIASVTLKSAGEMVTCDQEIDAYKMDKQNIKIFFFITFINYKGLSGKKAL